MIIDSSAVLAVLLGEEDAPFYASVIEHAGEAQMSAVSQLEVALVIKARKGQAGLTLLDRFLEASGIRIVAFDLEQLRLVREAWSTSGQHRRAAALSFGSCCAYALARSSGQTLLHKCGDFGLTDQGEIESPQAL